MTDAKPTKLYTGVTLDPDVAEILSDMTGRTRFNRSRLINAIVREYAALVAHDLATAMLRTGGARKLPQ